MEYKLDDNYYLKTDKYNWTIQKLSKVEDRKTKEIKEEFKDDGHNGTFEQALNYYSNEVLRDLGKVTQPEILEAIKDLKVHNSKIAKEIKVKLEDLHK